MLVVTALFGCCLFFRSATCFDFSSFKQRYRIFLRLSLYGSVISLGQLVCSGYYTVVFEEYVAMFIG